MRLHLVIYFIFRFICILPVAIYIHAQTQQLIYFILSPDNINSIARTLAPQYRRLCVCAVFFKSKFM